MHSRWAALARSLAAEKHRGQVDKSGHPYIGHPERVAELVSGDEAKAVAWLHDVVEDTDTTLADLGRFEFPQAVIRAVELLTKQPGTRLDDYYQVISTDALATEVKIADMLDNSSEARLQELDEATQERLRRKYRKGFLALGRNDLAEQLAVGENTLAI